MTKVWSARSCFERWTITDAPFAVYPNLWRSTDMLVTPGTVKFHDGIGSPSRAR